MLPALRQVPFTNADGSEGVDFYLDQEAFPGFKAERATATIEEVPASHASMVSQPDVATKLIITSVNAAAGATA